MEVNGHVISLRATTDAPLGDYAEGLVIQHTYDVVGRPAGDADEWRMPPIHVGVVEAYVLLAGRGHLEALLEDADAESNDIYRVAKAIYAAGTDDEASILDTVYVARIEIDEAWRGHRLGLLVAEAIIHRHGESSNVALIPEGGNKGLAQYWGKLGLAQVLRPNDGEPGILWHPGYLVRHRCQETA